MRIAIIGAGNVGAALSRAAVRAGHEVTVSAASPDKAAAVAAEAGASAGGSNRSAVEGVEVVVLAVPGSAAPAVAEELAPAVAGKVVVDVTNPLNATFTDLEITGTSAAEAVQRRLPGASLVKAFNTIFAGRYESPAEQGVPLDAFYAGDDTAAKAVVAELAGSLGFRPVDAGSLRMARALEEMAFLNITLNAGNGWPWQSGWKLVGPTG
jgi:NADPH-dependent F420 reductase